MAELTEEQKTAIVVGHARFMRPVEILAMLREDFDVEADRNQVIKLNPQRACYEGGEKWREAFDLARRAYTEEVASVPAANQGYRLNVLQEGIDAARKAKNWPLVAQLLEQSAKEVGGVLTNERNLRVDDSRRQRAADMDQDERKMAIAEVVRLALEQRALPQPVTIEGKAEIVP